MARLSTPIRGCDTFEEGERAMDGKDLLLRIIQARPNVTATQLAKFAYLFDLTCVYLLGKQASDIQYRWWRHGPYTPQIEELTWELEVEGRIQVRPYKTQSNHDCRLHEAVDTTTPRLQDTYEAVLALVMKRYSKLSSKQLVDVVYKTPPMIEAQRKEARMEPLKMDSLEATPELLKDRKAYEMILRSHKPGTKWIPASEVIKKLMALPLPNR
jgi:uncharacterized phage-associated protein